MSAAKADILAKLRREISALEGRRRGGEALTGDGHPGPLASAFPDGALPLGVVHEFLTDGPEGLAATCGFVSALLAPLLKTQTILFWISASRQVFAPALPYFGIAADRVIFVNLHREQDILWATEEILQSGAAAGVVTELPQISFIASRRLQLRAEQSGATGFLICHRPRPVSNTVGITGSSTQAAEKTGNRVHNPTACATRWEIRPLPGLPIDGLPGLGAPCWQVNLLKAKNGRPGSWEIQWKDGKLADVHQTIPLIPARRKKTG